MLWFGCLCAGDEKGLPMVGMLEAKFEYFYTIRWRAESLLSSLEVAAHSQVVKWQEVRRIKWCDAFKQSWTSRACD